MIQQEKMASLGSLTAGIAHEIKNPLNFVINFSKLSLKLIQSFEEAFQKGISTLNTDDQTELHSSLEKLKSNTDTVFVQGSKADSILKKMLAHASGKSGEYMSVDLHAVIDECIVLFQMGMSSKNPNFDVKIEREFDPTISQVEMATEDMSRVFFNMLNNAYFALSLKKEGPGGNAFKPLITIKTKNKGDKYEIAIRDNGVGIPENIAKKVFIPFFTTKPASLGTGLGLSLSHNIISQQHEGTLTFISKEGEFTEFTITLPVHMSAHIKVGNWVKENENRPQRISLNSPL